MNQTVLLENIQHSAATLLAEGGGADVRQIDTALSDRELIDALKDTSAVGIRSRAHI
jgi:hypothetical protein